MTPDVSSSSPRIVLITGMSGSGKSTAIRALEDVGFFCIDNLPVPLLGKLMELARYAGNMPQVAVVVDAREGRFLADTPQAIEGLRRDGLQVEVLFLDAADDALIRRFSETRRRHPISPEGTVPDGIAEERKLIRHLRAMADEVIDTTSVTVHELKRMIQSRFGEHVDGLLNVTVTSFGYRYGLPPQADLVVDVRFLPNPYFVAGMRERTGREPDVAAYVMEREEAQAFLTHVRGMVQFLLPHYRREGKSYLTVAIGCTGGKHRSVAFARALAEGLSGTETLVRVWDRDVEKD
ncbi:RNase adapter RapZ [Vulgatibacter incomptus]|uniref:Putative ATP-binding protein n=1 Tax=Vulgatibacter incomptus TaxID=1391653 RepID=A0A0K1PGK5_9BACT|nr:RNase adapter RapZ [Vulgatibacter incomptus]AKU92229.1 putative ATP-binding protein [Vulgatibacter incomptus]